MHTLGYLDPGSISMFASAVAAGIAGVFVFFKSGVKRVFRSISPKKRRADAEAEAADKAA